MIQYSKMFIMTFILALLVAPSTSFAYYSTLATGDTIKPNKIQLQLESQIMLQRPSGLNVVGHLERGLRSDITLGGFFGVGVIDFHFGGRIKWIPYPDTASQPAIGLIGDIGYANIDGFNELSIRVHPLVSKKIQSTLGLFTAYASLPLGLRNLDGHSQFPVNLNLGSQFNHKNLKHLKFIGEVGFDINESFPYLSFAVSFPFDEEKGILLD